MTTFHAWSYDRFIEIQSNLKRKKLHRTNYIKKIYIKNIKKKKLHKKLYKKLYIKKNRTN